MSTRVVVKLAARTRIARDFHGDHDLEIIYNRVSVIRDSIIQVSHKSIVKNIELFKIIMINTCTTCERIMLYSKHSNTLFL